MDDLIVLVGFIVAVVLLSPETPQQEIFYCTPEERVNRVCIEEFNPVCGFDMFGKEVGTYSNVCEVCQNPEVIYFTEGECD